MTTPTHSATYRSGRNLSRWFVWALIRGITLYQNMISPLRLPSCRFMPTCSEYAVEALLEYGLLRGSWLTMVRLAKCGPWHSGGWDPIPARPSQLPSTYTPIGASPKIGNMHV